MFKKGLKIVLMLSVILAIAGCANKAEDNDSKEVNVAVNDIADKIINEIDMGAMGTMQDEMAEASYPFDRSIVSEFVIYHAMMNVHSDEFAVFKVKDKNKISEIESAIENRVEELNKIWETYLPDQHEKVKNYIVEKNGNYVMFAITSDQEKAKEIFNSYMK